MPEAVYRTMNLLCPLVAACPLGTNLGLLHLLWMLVSGRLLGSRGALFSGLSECGLTAPATRRAWAALGQGGGARRGGPLAGAPARRLSPGGGRCDGLLAAPVAGLPDQPLP